MEKRTNKGIKNHLKGIFTNKTVISALGITLFLLIMFRLGSSITVPGIDISGMKKDDSNSFASMLNLLAGGGLNRLSLFAVGVGPYITAQIIVQLLSTDLVKPMARMAKLGERGRRKLEVITRVLTLPFCIAQSYAVLALLLQNSDSGIKIFGQTSLSDISAGKIIALMTIFTAGTYICIFIGDIITKRGVGQGVTLLILAGIVANIVPNFTTSFQYIKGKMDVQSSNYIINLVLSEGLYILFFVGILFAVIFVNGATRKIPVQQTGQGLTNKVEDLPFLPIKLNSAGVIPVIFASSILTIPGTIAQFLGNWSAGKDFVLKYLTLNSWSGLLLYFVLIVLFSFFYSYVQINPQQLSENFEKSGKFIPGVKNGEDTEKHITRVLNRINWLGGPFLGIIAVLPYILSQVSGIPSGLALGGTGMIIIVTATLELWNSIKSASTTSGYNVERRRIESRFMDEAIKNTSTEKTKVEQLW